jgi:hypothetical protein
MGRFLRSSIHVLYFEPVESLKVRFSIARIFLIFTPQSLSVEDNNSDDVKYFRLTLNMYLILSGNNRSFPT